MVPPENKDHSRTYREKKYRHLSEKEYIVLKNEQFKRRHWGMPFFVKSILIVTIVFVIGFGTVVVPLMFLRDLDKEVDPTKKKKQKGKKSKAEIHYIIRPSTPV